MPASDALLELLHNTEEGFLGFDYISPLKDVPDLSLRTVSPRLMAAVSERYELRAWSPAAHAIHKRTDSVAIALKAVHYVGWAAHEVHDILGIVHPVLDVDPLTETYSCRPWEPWATDVAAERFLDALKSLRVTVRG